MPIKTISYNSPFYDINKPRNVADNFQKLDIEEIKAAISATRNNFSLLLLNVDYDNNIGSIIRSANAFGASEIILLGRKKFDRRASVGVEFYTNFRQVEDFQSLGSLLKEFEIIVALENNTKFQTTKLHEFKWNKHKKTLICVGQESLGLPKELIEQCTDFVEITQKGSVRSLNVSAAAAITMYDYCFKTGYL